MDTLYVETSIVSHATAWPSTDIQIAAIQQQAREWWTNERSKFDLVTSQLVITEASAGDATAAADRLKLLDGIPLVPISSDAQNLADSIIAASLMPRKAAADALHVAVAAVAGVKYLLTQNCRHIANAHVLPQVYKMLQAEGFGQLLIARQRSFLEVMMTKNPILDEIHETREKLLADCGGTLAGLVERLQAEEKASGRTIRVTRRTSGSTGAADGTVSIGESLPAGR